ncbi:hypothetical protein B0I37DRAFT_348721 [Chaetomium sp. MPI-CAGE-AT-0009]|nr:hypothetical protein B0I37DRAFT_348721 [Chaetomium sp. MPI-CAGE-AT-0009]
MCLVSIWQAVWTTVGAIAEVITASPVTFSFFRSFFRSGEPNTPPHPPDPVPGLLEELRNDQRRIVEIQGAIVVGQEAIVERLNTGGKNLTDIAEGQKTLGENLKAIVEGQKAFGENLKVLADGQMEIVNALKAITDELKGARDDSNSGFDGVGLALSNVEAAIRSSAVAPGRLFESAGENPRGTPAMGLHLDVVPGLGSILLRVLSPRQSRSAINLDPGD